MCFVCEESIETKPVQEVYAKLTAFILRELTSCKGIYFSITELEKLAQKNLDDVGDQITYNMVIEVIRILNDSNFITKAFAEAQWRINY